MRFRNSLQAYGSISMLFHWLTAAAFISAYMVVYYVIWFVDPDTSIKPALFGTVPDPRRIVPLLNIHWVLGITIASLTLPRLLWRVYGTSVGHASTSKAEARAADAAHWALYGLLICMPLSGYMTTYDPTDFGLFVIPPCHDTAVGIWMRSLLGLDAKAFEDLTWTIHRFLGKWVAWPLVAVHISAALLHHFVRKDQVLRRMLPRH